MKNLNRYIFLIGLLVFSFSTISNAVFFSDSVYLNNNSDIDITVLFCGTDVDHQDKLKTLSVKSHIDINKKKSQIQITDKASANSFIDQTQKNQVLEVHIVPKLSPAILSSYNCNYSNPIHKYKDLKFPSTLNFNCECSNMAGEAKEVFYTPTPVVTDYSIYFNPDSLELTEVVGKYYCVDNKVRIKGNVMDVSFTNPNIISLEYLKSSIVDGEDCTPTKPYSVQAIENKKTIVAASLTPLTESQIVIVNSPNPSNQTVIHSDKGYCINNVITLQEFTSTTLTLNANDKISPLTTTGICNPDPLKTISTKPYPNTDVYHIVDTFQGITADTQDIPAPITKEAEVVFDVIGNYCVNDQLQISVEPSKIGPEYNNTTTYKFENNKEYTINFIGTATDCNILNSPKVKFTTKLDTSITISPSIYLDLSDFKCKYIEDNSTTDTQYNQTSNSSEVYLNNKSKFNIRVLPCFNGEVLYNKSGAIIETVVTNQSRQSIFSRSKLQFRDAIFNEYLNNDTNGVIDLEKYEPDLNKSLQFVTLPIETTNEDNNPIILIEACKSKSIINTFDNLKWGETYDFDCDCSTISTFKTTYSSTLTPKTISKYSLLQINSEDFLFFCVNNQLIKGNINNYTIDTDTVTISIVSNQEYFDTEVNSDCVNSTNVLTTALKPFKKYIFDVNLKELVTKPTIINTTLNTPNINQYLDYDPLKMSYFDICVNDNTRLLNAYSFYETLDITGLKRTLSLVEPLKIGDKLSMASVYRDEFTSEAVCSDKSITLSSQLQDITITNPNPTTVPKLELFKTIDTNLAQDNRSWVEMNIDLSSQQNTNLDKSQFSNKICVNNQLVSSQDVVLSDKSKSKLYSIPTGKSTISITNSIGTCAPSQETITIESIANQITSINAIGEINNNQLKCIFVTNRTINSSTPKSILPRTGADNNNISFVLLLTIIISLIIKNVTSYDQIY